MSALAGYTCTFVTDDYGVDARISEVQSFPAGNFIETGVHFNVQMKASHDYRHRGASTLYDPDVDAHNRLVAHTGGAIILVLFCIPQNPGDRLDLTEEYLKLHRCCYWYPRPDTLTTNKRSVTITIPRSSLFTPDACKALMDRARKRRL